MLQGKKIIVGVTGSIAAYKSAILIRLLIKAGAEVKVIMTDAAMDFITPLTLSTLSKQEVHHAFYHKETGAWTNHVELGLWADLFLIAPASANTLGKLAGGICDNLLAATYFSARCPVFLAPAMDLDMWAHPAVTTNIAKLNSFGNILISPQDGELASGLHGQGRMAEPEFIVDFIQNHFGNALLLTGKHILVTAGPTQEPLDPVRYLSNHSSGKMGYGIAEQAAACGAIVYLVSGPTQQKVTHPHIQHLPVNTAMEMYNECKKVFEKVDVAVFAAAVADYRPKEMAPRKIKKTEDSFVIEMVKNVDIAAEFGKVKSIEQISVGFALETDNELANARQKLQKKNFDMVILNSMNDSKATFGYDTNKITIVGKDNLLIEFPLKSKSEVAKDIINEIINLYS